MNVFLCVDFYLRYFIAMGSQPCIPGTFVSGVLCVACDQGSYAMVLNAGMFDSKCYIIIGHF